MNRRGFLGLGATALTAWLGLNVCKHMTMSDVEKLERSLDLNQLKTLSQEQFHNFTMNLISVMAREIPFYQKALEAIKDKSYQFRLYPDRAASETVVLYQRKRNFDALTDKENNKIYFHPDKLKAYRKTANLPDGRNFIGALSDELVHVIMDDVDSKTADGVMKNAAMTAYQLGRGKEEDKPKALTLSENFIISESVEESLSTVVSRLLFRSDYNQPIGEILKNAKIPGEIIKPSDLDTFIQEAVDGKFDSFKLTYQSSDDPRIWNTLKPGHEAMQARIKAQAIDSGLIKRQVLDKLKTLGIGD